MCRARSTAREIHSQVDLWVLETAPAAWKQEKREEVLLRGRQGQLSLSRGLAGFHFSVVRAS